jgi:flagellar motor switch protein FliG
MRVIRACIVISAAALLSSVLAFAQKDAKGSIESKIALESNMENRLRQVLVEITGTDKIIVIVNVQLAAEQTAVEAKKKDDDFILPGVPIKDGINEKQVGDAVMAALGEDTRTLIRKLTVTVILDKGVSESVVNVAKEVASGLLGIDATRGDQLVVKQMSFQKNPFYWSTLMYPPNIFWVLLILAGIGFVSALVLFLFGPFKGFAGQFITGIMAAAAALKENGRSSEEAAFSGGGSAALETLTGPQTEKTQTLPGREAPFSFINEANINALLFLIKGETSQNIASIVNYLAPVLAVKILQSLPLEKQKEVGTLLAQSRELDAAAIDTVEAMLRKRIGYLSGGPEKLTGILDYADEKTKTSILASIKAVNPQAAEQVQKALVSLDILADLDAAAISTIIKAVSPAAFGQVIKAMGEEFRDKVLAKLPAGAAARLRQEIEMGKDFNAIRLETEKRRMVDIIRRLEARGLISRGS